MAAQDSQINPQLSGFLYKLQNNSEQWSYNQQIKVRTVYKESQCKLCSLWLQSEPGSTLHVEITKEGKGKCNIKWEAYISRKPLRK